jgi:hypothetical protein
VEHPGRPLLLQLAAGRATVAPAATRPVGARLVRFVFIAEIGALSADEIDSVMDECVLRR